MRSQRKNTLAFLAVVFAIIFLPSAAFALDPLEDETADATTTIQQAVDQGGDVHFSAGTYRITQPIMVDLDEVGPISLTGTGTARIIMDGPGPAFKLIGTHHGTADPWNVDPGVLDQERMPVIDGLEILGNHPEAVGIEASGTMQLTVTRLTVRDALHGIHLTNSNRNVIISDSHLYNNRGVGVYLDSVNLHQINVSGSHISYNNGGGIVVSRSAMCNLQVSGCDIEYNMASDGPATANVLIDTLDSAAASAEIAIVGCTLQHSHSSPQSANIRFRGTDIEDRQSEDMVWGNLTIGNNVISDAEINIDVRNARGVSIVGNTLWRGYQYDLRVEESSNVVIGPNLFDRNPRYYWGGEPEHNGLLLRNCRDMTLTGLHLNDVRQQDAGLIIANSRNVNLTNSTILNCDNGGVLLKDCVNSRVSDCLILNDKPDSQSWRSLVVSGGQGIMVTDNMLGVPAEIDQSAVWGSTLPSKFECDFEFPVYTTDANYGSDSLIGQGNWTHVEGEGAAVHGVVSSENSCLGTQSLKTIADCKYGNDLGEDFGDKVSLKVSMSRDGMDTLSHGGLFVYLGAEGVDEADWSKVATQFGLGEGVVTYRDGPSTMVEVAPFEISEWYTFEASIHFDDTDPDGGFYDLTITSTDQNWTEFTATGIQFRGGADAVSAEDVLINRFNCGEATAWVDDLVIARRESIPGDLNDDGFVGGDDLDIIRNHWGQTVTMGKLEVGDPSGDGVVGGDDLDIIRANWGQGSPPMISTIPEPASWILLIGAAFTLAAGTRLHTLLKYPRCQNRVNY